MPAYRHVLILCPVDAHASLRVLPFPLWWDRAAFFDHFGSRQVDMGSWFAVDYGLLLTTAEALTWDAYSRTYFAADPRRENPAVLAAMDELAALLPGTRWVIVESHEWESGLE